MPVMDDRQKRAERRAFVRDHHPDLGGDPEEFIEGLHLLDEPAGSTPTRSAHFPPQAPAGPAGPDVPVYAYRSRRLAPTRWLRRIRGCLAGTPPRHLD